MSTSVGIPFDQILGGFAAIGTALTSAVAYLFHRLMSEVNDLKARQATCEAERTTDRKAMQVISEKAARLEGQIEEMKRLDTDSLIAKIVAAIQGVRT